MPQSANYQEKRQLAAAVGIVNNRESGKNEGRMGKRKERTGCRYGGTGGDRPSRPCRRPKNRPPTLGKEGKRGGKKLSAIAQQKTAALCSAKGTGGGFGQSAPALDWLKGE